MGVFSSVEPQTESPFPFLHIISKRAIFEAPSSTPGGDRDMPPCWLFCTQFNAQQPLFEAFLDVMRIFASGEP